MLHLTIFLQRKFPGPSHKLYPESKREMGGHAHKKKTRPGRERPPSRYYIKKRPKHGPGRENPRTLAPHHERAVTAHSATAQPEGGAQDVTRERAGHSEGIFLTKPEIRPRGDRTQDLKVLLGSLNHYARGPRT
jgi:hypothetical protein